MRFFVIFKGFPEGDDQGFLVLHRAFDRLADGGTFIGHLAAIQRYEATHEAGIGVIGLDVFTQESDPFLQVINGVFRFQNHTVNRDHTIIGKVFD